MCGIVGAVAERNVVPILLEGLRRLEYRGYDSAGIATLGNGSGFSRVRSQGKVNVLAQDVESASLKGHIGIAHTRWATHGKPSEKNAHPHICNNSVAVVHNGIIENFEALKASQLASGFKFTSETDTEVIAHSVCHNLEGDNLLAAVQQSLGELEGAYAIAVMLHSNPDELIVARKGSPLVIGLGIGENFIASDIAALIPVTNRFIILEDGDVAIVHRDVIKILDSAGQAVEREISSSNLTADVAEKGHYRHYMLKEIFEQPKAITDTLTDRLSHSDISLSSFGLEASQIFSEIKQVLILACGTSYHSGVVAKYWFESLVGIPCQVEIASEFRYRHPVVLEDALVVTISQSGETADTLAALEEAKRIGYKRSLCICNVAESSLVRASDLALLTRAGPEIGVASTKAFTTQLVALLMLVSSLGRSKGVSNEVETSIVKALNRLPLTIETVLAQVDQPIQALAETFIDKENCLFLGRGAMYPIAMEGALKLKEISYIHAEAYPAGELKHGPLALVDSEMPVIVVAPNNELLEKLKSNMQEVHARGGQLVVFADHQVDIGQDDGIRVISLEVDSDITAPIVFTLPLQLLSYHVAVLRGTDVDQPRNLAKSVTVE